MILARSVARRCRGTYGLGLDIHQSPRPRAGHMLSRQFSNGDKAESDKRQKLLYNISAAIGAATSLATALGSAGLYVINTVNAGVDEKFRAEKEATAAKLEAEKVQREGFQIFATQTHLDSIRKIDEVIADLRAQFNNLSVRCLEFQALEGFYRSQVVKAQEVLDRKGVTSSAEVHQQLVPRIGQLQLQINVLTEEVAKLRSFVQTLLLLQLETEEIAAEAAAVEAASNSKDSGAATAGKDEMVAASAGTLEEAANTKGSVAASKGQNGKKVATAGQPDAGSSGAKNSMSQDGGGPGSP